ncbi:type VI secretion system baseplate subunit TssE [Pseudomonas sp. 10B1]|uniref:type VI secretion system baseplate subunit TssE n=1 Tax=unclassified Pseudomonas TaxID=196821 RepID=UPI002AB56548|nr:MULTISPECIES: type VI secretion system baseplate subunit TssE [unclassified Pseudomonas]MDY7560396.1 type VI secretion system baseplate subunit TssE [Pseudomonas sp. AB6]MEA9977313.1 type VI secretion system baseplate subunit TssE [Pseudomonas sp. RTS4]MEA9994023.1 type VI secretion system baseplate subunit TssE [Pseudomonas sp. AA4]MEB0088642.1 type VI secretion system baseplate subunit TssE [Pseudomonas sp. RTI1]MEB0124359.1 type VI secretion system baseplate subunit TssE [Pseudomonas sp.
MPGTGIRPPLFERLAFSEEESQRPRFLDRYALAESVRNELLRLLNTRRAASPMTSPPTLLDYGIADWTAMQAQNSDDRRRMTREIRAAVTHFEPRLHLLDVDVQRVPDQPQRLSIRLSGTIRHDKQQWPVAFILDKSAAGVEVNHERLD